MEAMKIHHRYSERTAKTLIKDDLHIMFMKLGDEITESEDKAKEKMKKTQHLKI